MASGVEEDYSQPILPGAGGERLRAIPAHRRAARAAEDARGDGASRRAPLPDRAPVVGALAQARVLRGRDGDRGAARAQPGRGDPFAPPRERLPEDRDAAARHARAHVAVGVPDDPAHPRPRQRVRLAGLPQHPPCVAVARRGVRRTATRGRAFARRALRARSRVRGAVPGRRGADRVGRARLASGASVTTRSSRASSATRSSARRARRSSCSAA